MLYPLFSLESKNLTMTTMSLKTSEWIDCDERYQKALMPTLYGSIHTMNDKPKAQNNKKTESTICTKKNCQTKSIQVSESLLNAEQKLQGFEEDKEQPNESQKQSNLNDSNDNLGQSSSIKYNELRSQAKSHNPSFIKQKLISKSPSNRGFSFNKKKSKQKKINQIPNSIDPNPHPDYFNRTRSQYSQRSPQKTYYGNVEDFLDAGNRPTISFVYY
ncbi:unnamed protein product [Moneuplotes crassus]|uniref:Uncharacterized protein n=1 Tax=Euplotes crassus TaxID=5936 RepID=A0AAD2DBJ0_EUPCR|nr:unnamed protein product [Moneuplotes crassus]